MDLRKAARMLRHLVVLKNLTDDPLIESLACLHDADTEEDRHSAASAVASALYPEGVQLAEAVFARIRDDDHFFVRQHASGRKPDPLIRDQLHRELAALSMAVSGAVPQPEGPSWHTETVDFEQRYEQYLSRVAVEGYGLYARHRAFTLQENGRLVPVRHPDPLRIEDLVGYERERGAVLQNTEALISDLPASNILLYGDAGTGKSSTVKAVANAYYERGLRLIQVERQHLHAIPALLDELVENPLKFILFIDDLSFEKSDGHFNALKTVLEGSVSSRPRNVVVYATSNRRHLVSETFSARQGDDVHISDTLEEISGLSARFGMIITFGKPDRDEYLDLVFSLAEQGGLIRPAEQLMREAEAYAIRSGGRSPRTAKQFVEACISEEG